MSVNISILQSPLAGTIYRRHHVKGDGRNLYLYGYDKPTAQAFPEPEQLQPTGGELRFHPLRKEWSIYAAARQNRTFKPAAADDPLAPSRPGHPLTEIPFEEFELAVFDNRFPGLHPTTAPVPGRGHLDSRPAKGTCEVIVYSPDKQGSLATLSQTQRLLLVSAWNDRYESLFASGFEFVLPFENRGDDVGVTLHHPHGQLYAFPFVPTVQARAAEAFDQGFNLKGEFARWLKEYQVAETNGVVAFAPPFARYPYEVWLAPTARKPGPWVFTADELDGFAFLLGDITRRYDSFFGQSCPYMMSLHAAPRGRDKNFHFTAQFYPVLRASERLKYFASVEHSTGVFTVDVMPEETARVLKQL